MRAGTRATLADSYRCRKNSRIGLGRTRRILQCIRPEHIDCRRPVRRDKNRTIQTVNTKSPAQFVERMHSML
jgi:hypothetical protein